ncbi:hypothetical protein [Nocardia bhagyanarayanae]|uniref:hypothetical protein n=1 Tax=Nocardia bhagyanarayanae TaxID=1215925 RepID=UPI001152B17C|nr:hypothetical protein [Nocardia bhagyanarayanae]
MVSGGREQSPAKEAEELRQGERRSGSCSRQMLPRRGGRCGVSGERWWRRVFRANDVDAASAVWAVVAKLSAPGFRAEETDKASAG